MHINTPEKTKKIKNPLKPFKFKGLCFFLNLNLNLKTR
nr:MAG TPA: hypothetical protein [Caudoviricetes sp.]